MVDGYFLEVAPETVLGMDEFFGGVVEGLKGFSDLDVVLFVAVLAFGDGCGGSALALGEGGVFGWHLPGTLLGLHRVI